MKLKLFNLVEKGKFELISPDQLFEGFNPPKYYERFSKTFYMTIVVLACGASITEARQKKIKWMVRKPFALKFPSSGVGWGSVYCVHSINSVLS